MADIKFGVYRNSKLEVYDDKDAILILNLTEEDKEMIQNMSNDDMNFLKTESKTDVVQLSSVMCNFKKLCDNN